MGQDRDDFDVPQNFMLDFMRIGTGIPAENSRYNNNNHDTKF